MERANSIKTDQDVNIFYVNKILTIVLTYYMPSLRNIILETIADLGEVTLDAFFPAKYPQARMWRNLLGKSDYTFSRRSFSAILSNLRRDGLIKRRGSPKNTAWRISSKGDLHLRAVSYHLKSDGIQRLVIFDIPEKIRRTRDAIRSELISHGYIQLQKSVWFGTHPLPEDFIELLDSLKLGEYVHLFTVRTRGTLAQKS